MAKERKALVVRYDPHGTADSLDTLNAMLADGWLPILSSGMGAAGSDPKADGPHFAALVILEREKDFNVTGFGA